MSRARWAAIAIVGIAAVLALVMLRHSRSAASDEAPVPIAIVTIAPIRSESLQDVVSVYGVVAADPAGAITLAAPRAVRVLRIFVRSGESVRPGQPIVEISSAPAAELAFKQAVAAASFAKNDLARVQRLYDDRLAASDQLNAAKKALVDADAALHAQQKQGAGRGRQILSAPRAATVTNVAVSPGDFVAQDAPLVALAGSGSVTVKLGIEPGAARIAPGQAVTIRPIGGGAPISTHISMVGRAADPATKTFDAIALLTGGGPPIGAGVRGDIVTGVHVGLVVPRSAVVFDETGPHVFVVSGGKANRVFVKVGHDHGEDIEISGQLAAGDDVAVEGAYELQNGMAIKVRGP